MDGLLGVAGIIINYLVWLWIIPSFPAFSTSKFLHPANDEFGDQFGIRMTKKIAVSDFDKSEDPEILETKLG